MWKTIFQKIYSSIDMIMFLQSFDHYILTAINYTENISSRFSEEMFPQYHMHKDNFLHFCGNFIQMFEGYDHRSSFSLILTNLLLQVTHFYVTWDFNLLQIMHSMVSEILTWQLPFCTRWKLITNDCSIYFEYLKDISFKYIRFESPTL